MTKVYTTIDTSEFKIKGITLVGTQPVLNNYRDSRIEIRLNNCVRIKECPGLKEVVHRFNRAGGKGTRPTRGCTSKTGRRFVSGSSGMALFTPCHTISIEVSNSEVTTILIHRVRATRRV